jgi:hypothetical protein
MRLVVLVDAFLKRFRFPNNMSSAPVMGLNSYSAAQAAEAAGNPVPEVDGQNNIGVEPNYSLERPRDDQLTARAASTGTVVTKRK